MKNQEFKEKYSKAETWGDADEILRQMSIQELRAFVNHHTYVKETTGLDMRQEFYLGNAKSVLSHKIKEA